MPGKPVYHPASIQEDLRRRDFTVNSMAISLNEGSFGLLMDPLNGAADIETRTLRLVSNYGFLEEPSLLIRATRYRARLSWEMDPRTQARYDNAKNEGVIESLSAHERSQELEQIGHEEDGLKVLCALEAEGWMKFLFPAWTSAKADEAKLTALHDLAVELLLQGVHPDMSAAQMQQLTAKMAPKDLTALKKSMLRPGFVVEWNSLDSLASGFAKALLAKQNAKPSASFKLFMSYDPEAVLWLGLTSKVQAVQERFNLFLKVWPEARQRIPRALMQEMRITPELPIYNELVEKIFLELIDGRLTTPEEMRAYLEPYSPPPPPPQVAFKRPRAKRSSGAKIKELALDEDEELEEGLAVDDDLEPIGVDDEEIDLGMVLPKGVLATELGDETESEEEEELEGKETSAASAGKKKLLTIKEEKPAPDRAEKFLAAAKPEPLVAASAAKAGPAPKPVPAVKPPAPVKAQAVPVTKQKPAPTPVAAKAAKAVQPAAKKPEPAKAKPKPPAKAAAKVPAKKPAKSAPAKSPRPKAKPVKRISAKPSKQAAKKGAPKAARKR
jgi:tRNA nucleotidyltransferase/poly(A) polymerase